MDGLARTSGNLFREIQVADRTYRLSTPRLVDLAAAEAEILARLPDPVEQAARAAARLPAEAHGPLWDAAFKASQTARRFEMDDLDKLPTMLRAAVSVFMTLRRHHGEEIDSLDAALNWLDRATQEHSLADLVAIMEAAASETPPKKSPGADAE